MGQAADRDGFAAVAAPGVRVAVGTPVAEGRSKAAWFVLGALFFTIPLIVLALLPPRLPHIDLISPIPVVLHSVAFQGALNMLKPPILGLGAYAAVCMSAIPAGANDIYPPPPSFYLHAKDIDLRCEPVGGGTPWISNIAREYRINLGNSVVNGEILQIDQINEFTLFDAKVGKLAWNRPADGSVPVAHYVLNLRTNDIVVSFDKGEYGGRKFASTELRLRCIRPLIKYS
jgi:hypothetical protein